MRNQRDGQTHTQTDPSILYIRKEEDLFLADPPLVVSSRFTHVHASVRLSVRPQLTKLFNIFGSG